MTLYRKMFIFTTAFLLLAAASIAIIINAKTDACKIPLATIPAGSFLMGPSPGEQIQEPGMNQVLVKISRRFLMSTTEVTVGQFKKFVQSTGYQTSAEKAGSSITLIDVGWREVKDMNWRNPGFPQEDDHPVVDVSWLDTIAFANWLSDQEDLSRCYQGSTQWNQSCLGYRLPTSAEWEYAARAGTTTPYYTGPCISTDQANFDGRITTLNAQCPNGVYRANTVPVGSFMPNAWGIYDMHGNVSEWVWDCATSLDMYENNPSMSNSRIRRGGGWFDRAGRLRVDELSGASIQNGSGQMGFRVCRSLPE